MIDDDLIMQWHIDCHFCHIRVALLLMILWFFIKTCTVCILLIVFATLEGW